MNGADEVLPINPQELIRRQLTASLTSEADIVVRWSPALHALVHYGLVDFWKQLAPFFRPKNPSPHLRESPSVFVSRNLKTSSVSNHGDYHMTTRANRKPIKVQMFGDGSTESQIRPLELDVNLSTVILHFCLTEKQSLKLCVAPLR